jgi:hypothetical protein
MPKRLINLGAPNAPPATPKVIHTRGCQGQYVALSYYWGLHSFLAPKSTTLEKWRSPFLLKYFQTIRDAFLVAWKLDIQYIWIDVLCIIQDSKEDWHSEARRMGAIYANSYFTIAATAAKHSQEGFL